MRLIDADKLRKDVLDLPNCYNGFSDTYDKAMIIDLVDEQPTVDAEPTRHGHWILSDDRYWKTCSVCGTEIDVSMGMGIFCRNLEVDEMNYCPNCGAEMDAPTQKSVDKALKALEVTK